MRVMENSARLAVVLVAGFTLVAFAVDKKNEFRYNVGPGASVTVSNELGPVTVKGAPGHQVLITATTHSDKLEVDCSQTGNRVEAVTHYLQRSGDSHRQVEYQVSVPQDASVTVRAPGGPIAVEHLGGDVTLEGEAARVDVHDVSNAHVHVRTLSGPITLTNIQNGHVEITSVSGEVRLDSVDGKRVVVNTTKGPIRYNGDFGSGGEYQLVSYSGDVEVTMPPTASVDLSARSSRGAVQQDFPLQLKSHVPFQTSSRAFAGTSQAGASSVQLQSFSGTIRVRKR
jgi:DUF4097 and DUF4098 domain-containing protein YvlB